LEERKVYIMNKGWLLRAIMVCVAATVLLVGVSAQAQWLPSSWYYTNPLYYPSYGYSNPISGASTLLGYSPFSPFYDPAYISSLAALATPINIPSYGYPYSPYVTPFPYLTTPGAVSPYTSFSYPYYSYGSPSFYSTWSLLNGATYGLLP
jgi:hypothetical protein